MERSHPSADFWPQLLHRWFVEYNPLYLVSAMLVLGGMIMTSRGLAQEGSMVAPLGVALIAEVYAGVLIGGAALLTRIGQRRPAVMLGLLTVLYQSDLTLHTETCAFLGNVGAVAALAWLTLFVVKLYALAWALRIRLAPRAVATAALGALGLAAGPWLLRGLSANLAGGAVAVFVFALGSLLPRGAEQTATSLVAADEWSRTVLRRAVRATWIVWGTLLALHVLFWSTQHPIQLAAVGPALALLVAGRQRTEAFVWGVVLSVLALVFVVAPAGLSMCALLAALALVQRALVRGPSADVAHDERGAAGEERSPYRVRSGRAEPAASTVAQARMALVPLDAAARVRLFSGAVFGVYLSLWTFGWSGGALPEHILALDGALLTTVLFLAWRFEARLPLAPLGVTLAHGLVATGLVPPPRSLLEWGGAAVTLGFLLLLGSLLTSYRLRHVTPSRRGDPGYAPPPPEGDA